MLDTYLNEMNSITTEIASKIEYKTNLSNEEIDKFKKKLSEADAYKKKISNANFGLSVTARNEFKYKIDDCYLKYDSVMKKINKIELKNKSANTLKEPLLVNHNIRYDDANKNIKEEVNTAKNIGQTLKTGLNSLTMQTQMAEDANKKLENIEENLTLHDHYMSVVKNKALCSKLKIYFIVLMFFLGDIIMLYIKLSKTK